MVSDDGRGEDGEEVEGGGGQLTVSQREDGAGDCAGLLPAHPLEGDGGGAKVQAPGGDWDLVCLEI